jgi:xanthine phosphoribosyltransferase
MQQMIDLIKKEGVNLGNGILKVDSFINHQVDPQLMEACGQEFARLFAHTKPDRILTAEISGIAPALMTGKFLNVPVVYARKHKPVTMSDTVYLTAAPSHTKGVMVNLIVAHEFLPAGERVLIIDDFLASGATIQGLVELVNLAKATLVGIGSLLEKEFEGGRHKFAHLGIPVESLACITAMDDDSITLKE